MDRAVKAAMAAIRCRSSLVSGLNSGLISGTAPVRPLVVRCRPSETTPILELSTATGRCASEKSPPGPIDGYAYNLSMGTAGWTIRALRTALANGKVQPSALAVEALARSNQNAGHNTYLWQHSAWTQAEAAHAEAMAHGAGGPFGDLRAAFWGLPVSVKDCFDLAGAPTSCGVHFYGDLNGHAEKDSWLVERLRAAGAVITGKTHLHPLAYGITGENPEFGDCLQPRDASALTGGSSSGAAASVQEGSAVIAIGTDTGGSIRAPAALCGLAGYRASLGRGDWRGGAHLAQSFDTMGCLFRDLADAPLLAGLFSPEPTPEPESFTHFAVVEGSFFHDCEPEILTGLERTVDALEALGLRGARIDAGWWADSFEIFAPIQAWEAARIHAGHFDRFEASIRERFEWGARIPAPEIADLRQRHESFRDRMDDLLSAHELLLLPAAPVARLAAGADHSKTRARLLRYTTPFSLAGVPVVTIPCAVGGMQLAAARGSDESLLQLAARFASATAIP
jgi:Asp-tRNA(Asn)/Glu-tRNA(Gln) amidotransferase A subunit family amidase